MTEKSPVFRTWRATAIDGRSHERRSAQPLKSGPLGAEDDAQPSDRGSARRHLGGMLRRAPLQEQIDALLLDQHEAQPSVEPKCRIESLDVDSKRRRRRGRLSLKLTQHPAADAAPAKGRQQRNVDDADLAGPTPDV